jgi:hypothetical protein
LQGSLEKIIVQRLKTLNQQDQRHLQATEGWLGLGD